jgi:hypothetical protein
MREATEPVLVTVRPIAHMVRRVDMAKVQTLIFIIGGQFMTDGQVRGIR